jgi:FK506-binding protein 1
MRLLNLASVRNATLPSSQLRQLLPRPFLTNFSTSTFKMGVTKTTIAEGSGPSPQKGQTVTMEYTGWVKDASKPDSKGAQ